VKKLFSGKAVLVFLGFFLSASLFAQTADKLEALLNKPELSWSMAAAFVLEAANVESDGQVLSEDALPADRAFWFAAEHKWLPKAVVPEDAARLNGVALLLMQSFNLKGGIYYRVAKGPHHAYRELVYKNIIRGYTDPQMPVSGQQLISLISRILAMEEGSNEE